jgi:exodeoxyribonuclease VII small subunit
MNDPHDALSTLDMVQAHVEDGTFEEALAALEAVVDRLERGQLSIEEAVDWYETGLRLTRRCTDLLAHAELRIHTLENTYALSPQAMDPWSSDES